MHQLTLAMPSLFLLGPLCTLKHVDLISATLSLWAWCLHPLIPPLSLANHGHQKYWVYCNPYTHIQPVVASTLYLPTYLLLSPFLGGTQSIRGTPTGP